MKVCFGVKIKFSVYESLFLDLARLFVRFARNGAPKETISGFTRQPSNSRDPFSVRFAITVILLFNRRVGKSRIVK